MVACIAAWLVPAPARPTWREKRRSELQALLRLVDRGELVHLRREAVDYACFLFRSALRHRFAEGEAERLLRSAGTLVLAGALILAALALISGGFAGTRGFLREVKEHGMSEMVFGLSAPTTLALTAGLFIAWNNRPSLQFGWKYAVLLVSKLSFIAVVGPVLLIEVAALLRPFLPPETTRWFVVGITMRLGFIAFYISAVYQAVVDQRRRCPVCLRRLALPVRMGCWGSALEPPATEFVCEHGHGSMCLREDAGADADTWIRLDPSWRDLFVNSS